MKAKVILATILVLAASCVKNEVREVSMHGDGQILYNPAPLRSMTTKADVQTTKFPTNSTFGSCAWYLPGGNKWDDHHAAAATATVVPTLYIEPSVISNKDGQWKAWDSGKSYYWPMNGSLTFISWAPADLLDKVDASNNKLNSVTREEGFKITNWKMENTPGYGIVVTQTSEGSVATTDPKVDILLAQNKDCKKTADGKVVPRFSHILCKVKVEARLAKPLETDENPWKVTSVILSDIYTKGDYSTYVKDESNKITLSKLWRNQSDRRSYEYNPTNPVFVKYGEGGIGTGAVIFPETLFMPQFLTEMVEGNSTTLPMITIECENGKGEKQTLKGLLYKNASSLSVWNQGKSITYVITIGNETAYIDFTANVDGWSEYKDWINDGNVVPVQ